MNSITLAVSDNEHRVPGFAVEAAAGLFCMHDPAVRQWIAERQSSAGPDGFVLVARPEWVNPGDGTESLTFPIGGRDSEAIAAIWEKLNSGCTPNLMDNEAPYGQ